MITIVFLTLSLFATNYQKTYLMSDEVWQKTNRLCILNGVLGPTPVSPTTGENILRALRRLDYNRLSPKQQKIYDEIIHELDGTESDAQYKGDDYALKLSIDGALEGYAFTPLKSTYLNEFFIPYQNRPSMVGIEGELLIGNNLYLDFRYDLQDNYEGFMDTASGLTKSDAGYFYNFSNLSYLLSPSYNDGWDTAFSSSDVSHNMFNHTPLKAGASFGNENYNFYIGRNRQSFGSGHTGNLVISDNFPFQEFMKLEASTDFITYELSLTHFDNTQGPNNEGFTLNGEHQNRTMQRIDLNFSNRLRFAMNLGGLFNTDSPLDWRLIMPMAMVHNWVNNKEEIDLATGDEGNNIMGFELEYVLKPGLFVSGQIVIDQFQLVVETGSSVPNAFGLLANITKYVEKENYLVENKAEVLFTNPYLYLNTKKDSNGNYHWGYDWIVGYAYDGTETVDYSGHPFGPGTIALNLRRTYLFDKGSQFAANILFKVHGNKGIDYGYGKQNQHNQGSDNNISSSALLPTGYVEKTIRFDLAYSHPINEHLSARIQGASISQWNYHNEKGKFKQSLQGAFGVRWVM